MEILSILCFQFLKAFFFQQNAVVNDPDVVGKQGYLRQNVAGDQNGFSGGIAQLPDKAAHLRDANGVKAIDRLIQNQKFRVVHHGQSDGKTLLHAQGVLGKQFFIPVRQIDDFQSVFDKSGAFQAPQVGKNPKVFRSCQIRIKTRRFDQRADAGQDFLFAAAKRPAPDFYFAGGRGRKAQQHPHGGGFSGAVAAQQSVDAPFLHMDGQI